MEKIEKPKLPVRSEDAHKGDFGRVLIIGGSETMVGAPALAALGAARTGAGLVRVAVPKEILPAVITLCPTATGFALSSRDVKGLISFADEHDAVVVGPGLGQSPTVKRIVLDLLERHAGPLVLDADALNAIATLEASEWPQRRNWGNVVLTPHTGEFMRLMGAVSRRGGAMAMATAPGDRAEELSESKRKAAIQEDEHPSTADGAPLDWAEPSAEPATPTALPGAPDRTALAELLSRATGCVVVLKGHRTVIADGSRHAINDTGNPGMATAGSGDVLSGVIAALIGQRIPVAQAAVLGVYVHGLAGDLAAEAIGPVGLLATDIAAMLPKALVGSIG